MNAQHHSQCLTLYLDTLRVLQQGGDTVQQAQDRLALLLPSDEHRAILDKAVRLLREEDSQYTRYLASLPRPADPHERD